MLDAMNTSVDRCSNFYQYACGEWIRKTSIPDHSIQYGRLDELSKQNKVLIKDILNELMEKQADVKSGMNGSAIRKSVEYYKSCVIKLPQRHKGKMTKHREIKKLGTSPNKANKISSSTWNSLDVFVKLYNEMGVSPLFSLNVLPDLHN